MQRFRKVERFTIMFGNRLQQTLSGQRWPMVLREHGLDTLTDYCAAGILILKFIKCVEAAGFVSSSIISSQNALVYTYAMFLIGKFDYEIKPYDLRQIISKWFFVTFISSYYTGSVETRVERDLADIRNVDNGEEYIAILNNKINDIFTDDYFTTTLPNALATSSSRNPAWYGYCASLNILDAKVLFSQLHTRELFLPGSSGSKNALERHHLFPKAYLAQIGITDDRERNQNANFAFIEWQTNIEILDTSPAEYITEQLERIPAGDKELTYRQHALPDNWQNMDYFDFLEERRLLMADVIRHAFKKLSHGQPDNGSSLAESTDDESNTSEEGTPVLQPSKSTDDLIIEFHNEMVTTYHESKKLGYNPSYFWQMISEDGGYKTAKKLVNTSSPRAGLASLWEIHRLDLSVEANVLKPKYYELFTNEEREICATRFADYGYQVDEEIGESVSIQSR